MALPEYRTCGLCKRQDIPRGIEWPYWMNGECVHAACYTNEKTLRILSLSAYVDAISLHEKTAGESMFLGRPDRWYADAHYRCWNDHVSKAILKSEVEGDCCLKCGASVRLTFPEDRDGIITHPALPICGERGPLGAKCARPKEHLPYQKHSEPGFYDEW